MNITRLEILEKEMSDLQFEVKKLIGTNDKKAREKLAELTELQIELIDAIESYKNDDGQPPIN